jgi:hypothetical protein
MSNPERDFKAEPVNGKGVKITEYLGDKWKVIIPTRIQGLPVTCIGSNSFENKKLVGVKIPGSVTEIGGVAFIGNQLTSVKIPGRVTKIGNGAFEGNLLTSVTIGANVGLNNSFSDNSFEDAYNAAGKAAGTYTRPGTDSKTWTKV